MQILCKLPHSPAFSLTTKYQETYKAREHRHGRHSDGNDNTWKNRDTIQKMKRGER